MDFQLIIPCYNEALSLEVMLARTVQAATLAGYNSQSFNLVIVNNGSTDDSGAVLSRLQQGPHAAWFSVVTITQNKGYGDGIFQGLRSSTAPHLGWTHADEQCDPKDAFTALKALLQSPPDTLVKGRRHSRKCLDYLWSRGFELMVLLILRTPLWEINAQPKVFARTLLTELASPPTDFAFDLYVLWRARKAGWQMRTIPVFFAPRAHGVSRWAFSLKSRLKTGLKMFRYVWSLR